MAKFSGKSCLVVDDEPDLVDIISDYTEFMGFTTLRAGGGIEAAELLKTHSVDVIISDIRMPKGDGVYLLDKVKNDLLKENTKSPWVIFVSGFSDQVTFEKVLAWGAEALLPKPIDFDEFEKTIERALAPQDQLYKAQKGGAKKTIKINTESLFGDQSRRDFNLGRGGFFWTGQGQQLPNVGETIQFEINVSEGETRHIVGEGVTRWVRKNPDEMGERAGAGIELLYLAENCRAKLIELIARRQIIPFIPAD